MEHIRILSISIDNRKLSEEGRISSVSCTIPYVLQPGRGRSVRIGGCCHTATMAHGSAMATGQALRAGADSLGVALWRVHALQRTHARARQRLHACRHFELPSRGSRAARHCQGPQLPRRRSLDFVLLCPAWRDAQVVLMALAMRIDRAVHGTPGPGN